MSKQKLFISEKIKAFFSKINDSVVEAKNSRHLLTLMSKVAVKEFDADRASIFLQKIF